MSLKHPAQHFKLFYYIYCFSPEGMYVPCTCVAVGGQLAEGDLFLLPSGSQGTNSGLMP